MVVRGIVDSTDGAIRLHERVLALHDITVAGFPLALLIACVTVSDSVVERVAGVGLRRKEKKILVHTMKSPYSLTVTDSSTVKPTLRKKADILHTVFGSGVLCKASIYSRNTRFAYSKLIS